jgi:bifunctional UDP-N-acetylglucosamine pyrophosphorylase/glucosamine-1-phosphate N-acetyltransferase
MTQVGPAAVIVLAAGQGTRMKSALPKVLHQVAGEPMLHHVLRATAELDAAHRLVVIGHGAEQVAATLPGRATGGPGAAGVPCTVVQAEQRGTGHAVRTALEQVQEVTEGVVVVLPGDTPLITGATLRRLLDRHGETGAAVTILSAVLDDPKGYGRIVRDKDGHPIAIVEERDADEATRAIREVGTSIYAFDAEFLRLAVAKLTTDNDAGEEYLTDVVGLAADGGRVLAALTVEDPAEAAGVNDRAQLSVVARALRDRICEQWQRAGVSILDPQTTWIDAAVKLEPDVTIEPGVQLKGETRVASGAVVGPDTTLVDTVVGRDARVVRAHCLQSEIGPEAEVGPFAYLRPGSRLAAHGKIGTFVEVKNSDIGPGSKVPHLTYVGDATIGEGSNIGASSVFVNYDGVNKHRTTIGNHVRTGSDNTFVAPVSIGDGAYTGAGSVIREDVPPGALAVSAGPQRNLEGWVERKRPGTAAADAARTATAGKRRTDPEAPSTPADAGQ